MTHSYLDDDGVWKSLRSMLEGNLWAQKHCLNIESVTRWAIWPTPWVVLDRLLCAHPKYLQGGTVLGTCTMIAPPATLLPMEPSSGQPQPVPEQSGWSVRTFSISPFWIALGMPIPKAVCLITAYVYQFSIWSLQQLSRSTVWSSQS